MWKHGRCAVARESLGLLWTSGWRVKEAVQAHRLGEMEAGVVGQGCLGQGQSEKRGLRLRS